MELLFKPGKIGRLTVKNRSVMPPMQVLYGEMDGHPGPRAIGYYEERAKGGAGLIIIEATAVDDVNNTPWDYQLCLTKDRFISDFQQLTEAIHRHDCLVFVQLHSYGSKSAPTAQGAPWASSDIPALPGGKPGHRMSEEEIKTVEQRFAAAALRAKKAGFDGVELAGTHGYLLHQFLSPYYNDRTDKYGGSAENRLRIYTEIIELIHRTCGRDFAVSVRFPGDEFTPHIPGTLTVRDAPETARILEKAGADVLNVSNGNNFNANANCEPYSYASGWKKHVAKAVKEAVSIPVIATNTIKSPSFAEQMLAEGVCDFVALGRSLIADPMFMNKAAAGDELGIRKCLGCMFCREQLYSIMPVKCALNPRVGCEHVYPLRPERDGNGRTVAVLGGGPAGMQAAVTLAQRGFAVTLFEKERQLGGSMNLADKGQFKEKITAAAETMAEELRREGVKVILGEAPTVERLQALEPAGVVLACGAEPIIPPVPGVERANVTTSHEVISGRQKVSGRVAVIGAGMTGLECAEKLCAEGCKLSIVELQDKLGTGMFSVIVADLLSRITPHEPDIHTGCALTGIGEKGLSVKDLATGAVHELEADWVVLSLGVKPRGDYLESVKAAFPKALVIGDNRESGRIPHAIKDAYIKSLCYLSES